MPRTTKKGFSFTFAEMAKISAAREKSGLSPLPGVPSIRSRGLRKQIKKRAKISRSALSDPNRIFAAQKRRKNPGWYIHIQRGRGPVMIFNGRSFTNQPDDKPKPFASANAAMYKARHLLGQHHDKLKAYKIWVADMIYGASHEKRRVNPDVRQKLDQAAQKLEDFTGHGATHVERVRTRSDERTGLVIGEMDQIDYRAAREGVEGGRMVRYRHKFRKGSRPLLAVSTDGKQLHVVGGQYEFTEAGIEDR